MAFYLPEVIFANLNALPSGNTLTGPPILSGGLIYVPVDDQDAGKTRVFSSMDGITWAEEDSANAPALIGDITNTPSGFVLMRQVFPNQFISYATFTPGSGWSAIQLGGAIPGTLSFGGFLYRPDGTFMGFRQARV